MFLLGRHVYPESEEMNIDYKNLFKYFQMFSFLILQAIRISNNNI